MPCVNQIGLVLPYLENEIKNYLNQDVKDCFDEMVSSFDRQGFEVNPRYDGFQIELSPNLVTVQTISELTLTKSDETTTQQNFKAGLRSSLYDNLLVVQEIINQQAIFCNFDTNGFSILYPDFDIREIKVDNLQSSIYVVKNVDGGDFRFAVRSCVIPVF